MKRLIPFVVFFFVLVGASWQVAAVNSDDLKKLKAHNACKSCDLSGANLIESNLTGANLFGANLSGVDLSGANLVGAKVGEANLSGAYLSGANLNGAYLTGAYLTETIICETIMSDGTINNSGCGKTFSATTSKQIAKSEEAPKPEAKPEFADLVAKLDPTVVLVQGRDKDGSWHGHGTGFFVSESGYLLTNEHVADSHKMRTGEVILTIWTLDGRSYPARPIKSDMENDLALLKVVAPTRQFPSVTIGNSDQIRKGEPVFNIGNPGTANEKYRHSLVVGVVSGLNRKEGLIELSMPGRGGTSGSPVFNAAGQVIGVVVAGPVEESGFFLRPVNVPFTDADGQKAYRKETRRVKVYTESETITLTIPINFTRNLLRLTSP